MKVAIVSGGRDSRLMGIGLAERRLLDALRTERAGVSIDPRVIGGRAARRHARAIGARWYPARPQRLPPRACRAADVIHLLGLDFPPPVRAPFVVSIYDAAAERFPDEAPLPEWGAEVTARAARVITPTRSAARDLEEIRGVCPSRIRVIPLAPANDVSSSSHQLSEGQLEILNLRKPYVVRFGGYTQRKNVAVLLRSWLGVRRRTGATLALVGPATPARDRALAAAPSLEGIVVLDYLPEDVLGGVLRTAAALVSPSVYEGFGLPPLEAMEAGVPVVAVRTASVEEVCGEAAMLVDNDPAALEDGLVRVLEDPDRRQGLSVAGRQRAAAFSWDITAASVIQVYRELSDCSDA